MYKINENLIMREEDNSLFSLENMEIYEFNEVGFKAILIFNEEKIENYSQWEKEVSKIENLDISDLNEFWQNLIDVKILEEK